MSSELPSATRLRRLCFYRRLSVHRGSVCLSAWWDTPPQSRPPRADTPQEQTPPKQTPPRADNPREQTPPGADTPPRADPPGADTDTPRADTPPEQTPPPWSRHLPRETATAADGTHPTGFFVHSCFILFYPSSNKTMHRDSISLNIEFSCDVLSLQELSTANM